MRSWLRPSTSNGQSVTREALKQALAGRRVAFPDIQVTVDDQVAEGEKVSTRRTWRATHKGPYRGVAPTGKAVKWTQISVVRSAQGKIAEDPAVADEPGILQQLGALPREPVDGGVMLTARTTAVAAGAQPHLVLSRRLFRE